MSYKTEFASNNTDLQTILDTVNALPEAGGSEYIQVTMTNAYGTISYINESGGYGTVLQGETVTAKVYRGVVWASSVMEPTATGDYINMGIASDNLFIFKSDGGTIATRD